MKRTFFILLFLCMSNMTIEAFSNSPKYTEDKQLKEIIELADKGYLEAQYIIGKAALFDEIDFSDEKLAMHWLENAVQKQPRYAWLIGLAYDGNIKEAEKWYQKAANLGFHQAFLDLGYLYWGRQKSDRDNTKAKKFFEKALSHNQTGAFAPLGYMYMKGLGIDQDLLKAETLLHKAISYNDPSGFYYIGLLEQFHKTGSNIHRAIQHYTKAAENGDISAIVQIVRTYLKYPTQTELSQEEVLSWAFIAQNWGALIKPDTYSFLTKGFSANRVMKIKIKAEAQFKSFSQ